jgi:hypothetical protein
MKQPTDLAPGTLLANPGYHLVAIAKGELGELSKVREELDELADAMAQGSRIMAAVELADMLGAIEAFRDRHLPTVEIVPGAHVAAMGDITGIRLELESLAATMARAPGGAGVSFAGLLAAIVAFATRHLPGTTLQDLVTFSAITKRAFVNGRRSSK